VCITRLSSGIVVARTKLSYEFYCAATLPDGSHAVSGYGGHAALVDEPADAADILKAHGAAAFPETAAEPSALAIAEPLSPLQNSVVLVAAGALTARVACRDLISTDSCSLSLAE
jgi:hypothetical protein